MGKLELDQPKRLLTLFLNYIPVLHVIVCVLFFLGLMEICLTTAILGTLFCLYILPPLIARVLLQVHPLRQQHIPIGSSDYFIWWAIFCLQVVFLRFPFLEELLRMIPSFYSSWLRLWGAKIGKFTYWAPGTTVLDRPFLEIGNFVVFGAGVRLNPHVIEGNDLILAPVIIEDNVTVGGYSLLTSGTVLKKDQSVKAFLISPPFSVWQDNKRVEK
ncbi:MAG: hypothetical protein HQL24_09465 [Candidatus Omnitrophica bacterium]|nr:hypothetical protein [Candidatus Omnitrophota bacterium]